MGSGSEGETNFPRMGLDPSRAQRPTLTHVITRLLKRQSRTAVELLSTLPPWRTKRGTPINFQTPRKELSPPRDLAVEIIPPNDPGGSLTRHGQAAHLAYPQVRGPMCMISP